MAVRKPMYYDLDSLKEITLKTLYAAGA